MSAQDIQAGRASVKLMLNETDFQRGLRRASDRLRTAGKSMQAFGRSMAMAGGAVLTPFALAIKAASDAQETMSKFSVVFGAQSDAMKAWGDKLAGTVGRSKTEVAGMLASFQDLLVPMGMAADSAGAMSQQLATLAIDLGSFNNMADEDVARDLAAALTGSGEVMKKYGVIVSEAAVKQELLNMKLDPKVATEAQKAQARLNIIMAGTTAAQGDAERTAGGFANQMKALKAKIADTAVEIGTALLPVVTPLLAKFSEAVTVAAKWASENAELVKSIAKWAAIGTAAAVGIYAVGTAMTATAATVGTLKVALTLLCAHPVVAGIAALAAAVLILKANLSSAKTEAEELEEILARGGGRSSDFTPWSPEIQREHDRQRDAEVAAEKEAKKEKPPTGAATSGGSTGFASGLFGAFNGAVNQAGVEARALAMRARFEAAPAVAAGGTFMDDLQAGREHADELQRVDDEIARARIDSMQEGIAKEKAMLQLERDIRVREAKESGLLTPELQARIDELLGQRQNAAMAGVSGGRPDMAAEIFSTFSAQALRAQGAGGEEKTASEIRLLRQQQAREHREAMQNNVLG